MELPNRGFKLPNSTSDVLQDAMIVKSLPKYMYMYCPALSSIKFVSQLKCFGMQSPGKDKEMYGSF